MTTSAAARRYARALFMLGKEDHTVPQVRGELDALARLFDESPSPTGSSVTNGPSIASITSSKEISSAGRSNW